MTYKVFGGILNLTLSMYLSVHTFSSNSCLFSLLQGMQKEMHDSWHHHC